MRLLCIVQVEPHTEGLQQFSVRVRDSLASGSAPGLARPQHAELRSSFGADGAVGPPAEMLSCLLQQTEASSNR